MFVQMSAVMLYLRLQYCSYNTQIFYSRLCGYIQNVLKRSGKYAGYSCTVALLYSVGVQSVQNHDHLLSYILICDKE